MKIIRASFVIESDLSSQLLIDIERYGRTCYKSECREINVETAKKFVAMLIERGHESVLEHGSITVRFIVDRGVSHEIVRHRIASYSQESTRYCNYSKGKFGSEITVIDPNSSWQPMNSRAWDSWRQACIEAELRYMWLINKHGQPPQMARAVLPNSLKTEIVMTANPREWRHFFSLRTAPAAHPQMREVAIPLLAECRRRCPVIFDDIGTIEVPTDDM